MATIRSRTGRQKRRGRENGSFWISFSDLMSSLLLIFILIMFYIMYQYFDMYEINMAEIARQQFDLDEANAALSDQQAKLNAAEEELSIQQGKLTAAEEEMIVQQIRLNAAQEDLESAESILASQQEELAKAQSLLDEKETELAAQQEKLDSLSIQLGQQQTQIATQQRQLEEQQVQIEQLVGVRTRIITDLSDALRASNINATVDPTSGAIALESDVLFPVNSYILADAGKQRIDAFLPVYLSVLFSDQYKDYIAEVIIEGHTDSDGGYLSNLMLSQQRALSVAAYVLADDYHAINGNQRSMLRQRATVNGRSYVDRIMVNGVEDKDASRRVVFKFRLTDEEMIAQLQSILENEGVTGE